MRRAIIAVLVCASVAGPVRAQNSRPTLVTHLTDTAQIVLETRLGGDSSQATSVKLRPGGTYLVAAHTHGAQIRIRHFAHHGTAQPPLDPRPLQPGDSVVGWDEFRVVAGEGGDHSVELMNPGVGMTSVKILLMHRAPGDTLPTTLQHELVFSDHVGPTPNYVTLDSGVTYRILPTTNVYITPRVGGAQPFEVAYADAGAAGFAYRPPVTGEYRIVTDGDDGAVRIYREASDQIAEQCGHVGGTGCGYRPGRSPRAALAVALFIPVVAILDKLFR